MNNSKRTVSFSLLLSIILMLSLLAGCSVAPDAVGVQDARTRAVINLDNYYADAYGKTGTALRSALKTIISSGHSVTSYTGLWTAYQSYDLTASGKIWDMYSDDGTGSQPYYSFTPGTDQCGTYSGESSCYNREHSWPKSWFSDASPMYSDMVHVVPTDGYVNGRRSNWAFGQVGSASWTSRNGSKLGSPDSQMVAWGCTESTVFEPIDAFKGDFARIYFYMVTRYNGTSESGPMSSNFTLKPWAKAMLLAWHQMDPVCQKEIDRNDGIYNTQGNRNPFVDHPEWVNAIWGDGTVSSSSSTASSSSAADSSSSVAQSSSDSGVTAGSEDFEGCSETVGSYVSGSFTGTTGVYWTYTYTRWDQTLDGKAPAMGKDVTGEIASGSINGGLGTLTFKYKQAFSTAVNFTVYVNGNAVTTVSSGASGTVSVPVNVTGTFNISFKQNSGGGQVVIDTVSWTANEPVVSSSSVASSSSQEPSSSSVASSSSQEPSSSSVASSSSQSAVTAGSEDFEGCSETVGSYVNGSFTGTTGVSWTYTYTRWDQLLDGKAPAMGKDVTGEIASGLIDGGLGTLTFKYKQAFSTAVDFTVYVNGTAVQTVNSGSEGAVSVPVNVAGAFTVSFKQNSGGGQVIIDTLSWSAYDGSPVSSSSVASSSSSVASSSSSVASSSSSVASSSSSVASSSSSVASSSSSAPAATWNTESVSLSSPNYPGYYPNNYSNTWTISQPGAEKIKLNFAAFNIQSRKDTVEILNSNGQVVASYDGYMGAFTTAEITGSTVYIRFTADRRTSYSGWLISSYEWYGVK